MMGGREGIRAEHAWLGCGVWRGLTHVEGTWPRRCRAALAVGTAWTAVDARSPSVLQHCYEGWVCLGRGVTQGTVKLLRALVELMCGCPHVDVGGFASAAKQCS